MHGEPCCLSHPAPPCLPAAHVQDPDTQIMWWVLMVCDPGAWTPGEADAEAERQGGRAYQLRSRDARVRWDALETVLQAVVDTDGSMKRYRKRWQWGQWWWHMLPGSTRYGGERSSRCPGV